MSRLFDSWGVGGCRYPNDTPFEWRLCVVGGAVEQGKARSKHEAWADLTDMMLHWRFL